MALGKTYSTKYLVDSNGNTGAANQVLVSTATGVDWVDGSGSVIIGGPYLPLAAGSTVPLSGDLYLNNATYIRSTDSNGAVPRMFGINPSNSTYIGPIDAYAGGAIFYGVSANVSAQTFYTGASARMHINSAGNVGIGTTAPGEKLVVSNSGAAGFEWVPSTGRWYRYNRSTSAYAGIYTEASEHTWSIGASEAMRITSAGNVGIGTTSPGAKLDVEDGNIRVTTNNTFSNLISGRAGIPSSGGYNLGGLLFQAYSTGTTYTTGTAIYSYSDGAAWTSTSAPSYLSFHTTPTNSVTSTEKMVIKSNGNVGIGTTAPGAYAKLNVVSSAQYQGIVFGNGTNNVGWISGTSAGNDNGQLSLSSGGVQKIQLNAAQNSYFNGGNVGIGTTNPTAKLEVGGFSTNTSSIKAGTLEIQSYDINNGWFAENLYYNGSAGGWTLRNTGYATQIYMQEGAIEFKRAATGAAGSTASITSTMRLLNNGNVGIGTTSPGEKLHVIGNTILQATSTGNGTSAIRVNNSVGTQVLAIGAAGEIIMNNSSKISTIVNPTSTQPQLELYNGGTGYTTLQSSTSYGLLLNPSGGNVGIGTTAPSALLHVAGTARIDNTGASVSNQYAPDGANSVESIVGNNTDNNVLGTPDIWLKINVGGTEYVFPGYTEP